MCGLVATCNQGHNELYTCHKFASARIYRYLGDSKLSGTLPESLTKLKHLNKMCARRSVLRWACRALPFRILCRGIIWMMSKYARPLAYDVNQTKLCRVLGNNKISGTIPFELAKVIAHPGEGLDMRRSKGNGAAGHGRFPNHNRPHHRARG